MQIPDIELGLVVVVVLVVILLLNYSEKKYPHLRFYFRKALHIIVVFMAAYVSMFVMSVWVPLIAWMSSGALLFMIRKGWFEEMGSINENPRKSWGILYFSLTYSVLTTIPFLLTSLQQPMLKLLLWMNGWSFMVLAFADGLAGWLGRWSMQKKQTQITAGSNFKFINQANKKGIIEVGSDNKSLFGFLVFWLVTVAVSVVFLEFTQDFMELNGRQFGWDVLLPQILVFGFVLALIELISTNGSDNLFVVISAWLMAGSLGLGLMNYPHLIFYAGPEGLFYYMVLSILFGFILLKYGWLEITGVIMAWILAFVVVMMSNWTLVPLLVFMASATMVGKLRRQNGNNEFGDKKDGKPRDRWQVLANGGIYLIFGLVTYCFEMGLGDIFGFDNNPVIQEKFLVLALASLSASSADTLSSELGQWLGGNPRFLLSWRKVPKGLSGGVTIAGLFGGVLGALLIASCVFLISQERFVIAEMKIWVVFGWIFLLGMVGTLVDSIIGEVFQAKYLTKNGELTDNSEIRSDDKPSMGYSWINNDGVNFISNAIVTVLMYWVIF